MLPGDFCEFESIWSDMSNAPLMLILIVGTKTTPKNRLHEYVPMRTDQGVLRNKWMPTRTAARLKVFTPQTLPASDEPFDDPVSTVGGFSLHVGVAKAHHRQKLE